MASRYILPRARNKSFSSLLYASPVARAPLPSPLVPFAVWNCRGPKASPPSLALCTAVSPPACTFISGLRGSGISAGFSRQQAQRQSGFLKLPLGSPPQPRGRATAGEGQLLITRSGAPPSRAGHSVRHAPASSLFVLGRHSTQLLLAAHVSGLWMKERRERERENKESPGESLRRARIESSLRASPAFSPRAAKVGTARDHHPETPN